MMRKLLPYVVLALVAAWPGLVQADTGELFRLERMVVAAAVEEREPVGVADLFAAELDKIYAFIEARQISRDTQVTFLWSRNGQEVARVNLGLRQGPRWRTFSSVILDRRTGDWRVELLDEAGQQLQALDFKVR
ncbi:MAG TPA: DUF2914 domain-containing protein [Desulfurivibrio alkaliphilus]|uniref:DUF2914 domain-containing protein n=1 Tax=Desulfurivibrio alkaliphilus TaxID=427923 RepID=A0A7C2XA47_9BACT|nr:DUF2914 domain-containing protein [Desulfurivibrio alkaliphilus]